MLARERRPQGEELLGELGDDRVVDAAACHQVVDDAEGGEVLSRTRRIGAEGAGDRPPWIPGRRRGRRRLPLADGHERHLALRRLSHQAGDSVGDGFGRRRANRHQRLDLLLAESLGGFPGQHLDDAYRRRLHAMLAQDGLDQPDVEADTATHDTDGLARQVGPALDPGIRRSRKHHRIALPYGDGHCRGREGDVSAHDGEVDLSRSMRAALSEGESDETSRRRTLDRSRWRASRRASISFAASDPAGPTAMVTVVGRLYQKVRSAAQPMRAQITEKIDRRVRDMGSQVPQG